MPRASRLRLRLSPLWLRFCEPDINPTGPPRSTMRHYICTITSEDSDTGQITAYHLHSRKGWRKRRVN